MKSDLKRAKKLLSDNKIDKALGLLRSVIDQLNGQSRFVVSWPAYHMMGIAFSQKGEHESSARYLRKALDLGSTEPETYHMLSVNYFNLAQFEKAEKYGRIAVEQKDDFLKAWLNLGAVYRAQAKLEESLKCFHKVNQLDPTNEDVAYRLGKIYRDLGDMEKAHQLFDFALKMNEGHARAFLEKADLYKNTGAFDKAKEYIEEARERYEQDTAANIALADIYRNEGNYDKALSLYKDILENADSDQHRSLVRINYALSLQEVSRFDESEKNYRQAIKEMPGSFHAISNYLMGLHYNPPNSKEHIFEEHLRLGKKFKQESESVVPSNTSKNKKLRVGFISGGFRRHPVGFMVTGALEQLSGDHIEVYCYTANNKHDFITKRIHKNVDKWKSVVGYNHDVVTKLIRDDEIDILVDLTGHAKHSQLQVMARRPAPIIVKWVGGLFNTTGMEAFDYLISDWYESPEGEEEYYIEKLARMPDDYISYTPPAYAPDVGPLPAEKNGYITFGCFNNPTKVNEEVLKKWARIMNEVPESRLYLKSKQYDTPSFRDQITEVMEDQGIASKRILFDGHSSHDDHLEASNKVDVAFDPWPYSGGLTTCESLYMGVPVITMPGPTFAGRHSTTHLINADLEEFVVDSWKEYIKKTIELAKDWDRLKEIRSSLRDQLLDSVVCDGKRFGAHLSVAFREMWKQWVDGYENDTAEWQDHIDVAPLSEVKIDELTTGPDKTPLIKRKGESIEELSEPSKEKDFTNGKYKATNGEVAARPQDKVRRIETADGVTVCTPDDLDLLTPYVLLEQKKWFEPELDFVRDYLQPGMKALDIGATFGVYALPMAKQVGKKGAVYAFEPGTIAKKHLEKSKAENDFDQLEVISRAAGDEVSEVGFNIAETPVLNTVVAEGEQEVSQTTVDAWWNFAGKPDMDLIKIDVNGMEQKVLKGASEMLKNSSPVVLVSIGDNGKLLSAVREQLNDLGYDLFEYIPGPGLLAGHEPEAGVDGYLMNVLAVKQDSVDELKELGWIFDEGVDVEAADVRGWKGYIEQMPWAKSQWEKWEKQVDKQQYEEYLKALSLACVAEDMTVSEDDTRARSRKGAMLLTAAQKLIGVLNSGKGSIPVALTFVRVMNQLGKRGQAVEMMQGLMENLNSGVDPQTFLPFLPPLPKQDHTKIQTDFSKWLTVRVVEAWIKIKDVSTYMSDQKEREMLMALEGNPEIAKDFKSKIKLATNNKQFISSQPTFVHLCFNNMHVQSFVKLLKTINDSGSQKHITFIEQRRSVNKFSVDLSGLDDAYFFDYRKIAHLIKKVESISPAAIIVHGLFFPWQKKFVKEISTSAPIYWSVWGGDLYNPIQQGRPFYEVFEKLDGVISKVDGDFELLSKTYGEKPRIASYTYGVRDNLEKIANKVSRVKPARIIIGNSGDPSNNHLEVLKVLADKRDIQDYRLYIPFAYNGTQEYLFKIKELVQRCGLENITSFQTEFIPPYEYDKILGESSYLVCAHERQQALGTIKSSLYFGNIVFVRNKTSNSEISPNWRHMKEQGLPVQSWEDLKKAEKISEFEFPSRETIKSIRENLKYKSDIEAAGQKVSQAHKEILQIRNSNN